LRQTLGQHFLIKGKTLERIAVAACGTGTPLVVEIGPGRGALTERLLAHAERVVAIEIDEALVQYIQDRWSGEPRLEVQKGNALEMDLSGWGEGVLAGNLPYYAATPIISKYVRQPGRLRQAVFLIQKEVAERITAKPCTREYGYLSVECQLYTQTEYLFSVAPGAFQPPPKVDSAVIRLTPRAELAVPDPEAFLRFVSACFRQKRKMLRNNVPNAPEPYGSRRAETLTMAEFVELYGITRSGFIQSNPAPT
jgi:16S rRNA (adenine1518-N6/adenine1519-N6)-dimethyltransferase